VASRVEFLFSNFPIPFDLNHIPVKRPNA
jgi:hypothetical protein